MSDEERPVEAPRIEFKVALGNRRTRPTPAMAGAEPTGTAAPQAIPRVARLLALAHRWQRLIDEGQVESQAEVARVMGLSRARVSQIIELRWLAPAVQEAIVLPADLGVPPAHLLERHLRRLTQAVLWADQLAE
jgi:hypothetical protein